MIVDTSELISAGNVSPGDDHYKVALAIEHPTLSVGDVVTLRTFNNTDFVLVKVDSLTLHKLRGDEDDYVLLIKEPEKKI